ncbi:hypothetical protein NNO_0620 [Hydrogenimonas sp.]|nr:hypothetical protein NNO_0620 [Hydrogenimonas sp.]
MMGKSVGTISGVLLSAMLFLVSAQGDTSVRYMLQDLEKRIVESPDISMAVADIEMKKGELEREKALGGLTAFGTVGVGRYKDLVDENSVWYHTGGRFVAGLSLPLLGSKLMKRDAVLDAETLVEEQILKKEDTKRESLAALRSAYIGYWSAMKKRDVAEAFLQGCDDTVTILQDRASKGFILPVEALEASRQCMKARVLEKRYRVSMRRFLQMIRYLTVADLPEFIPYTPKMELPDQEKAYMLAEAAERDPSVRIARLHLENAMKKSDNTFLKSIESDLRLVGFVAPEYDSNRQGHGVEITFNVKFPLALDEASKAQKRIEHAQIVKTALALRKTYGERVSNLRIAVDAWTTAVENYRYAKSYLEKESESLREALLRLSRFSQDGYLKIRDARYDYFRSALETIDAYAGMETAAVHILRYLPEDYAAMHTESVRFDDAIEAPLAMNLDVQSVSSGPQTGVYLWDSRLWLTDDTMWKKLLSKLQEAGLNRVLIGLDGDQIRALDRPAMKDRMKRYIREAHAAGIEVDLLLGEPTWLLPEHRYKLLQIVGRLEPIPFDKVNLDLEPQQLDREITPKEGARLVYETLAAVRSVSSVPLGVTLHPRLLNREETEMDLGKLLADIGIREIVPMLYGYGIEAVAEWERKFIAAYPKLPRIAALSLEKEVPENPFALSDREKLRNKIENLRSAPGMESLSILLQDFSRLERMKP